MLDCIRYYTCVYNQECIYLFISVLEVKIGEGKSFVGGNKIQQLSELEADRYIFEAHIDT